MLNMLNTLPDIAANSLWLAGGARAALRFTQALLQPRRVQETLLLSLLRRNAQAAYGRRHRFERLRSVRDYQEAVPIVGYDDLQEEIEAIKRGQTNVLSEEKVLMLEKSGGSTAASKYIPYTASLKREFGAAIAPWMSDLYTHRPGLLSGGAYWSVSPLAAQRETTAGGLPVGFEEDSEYFGPLEQLLLSRLLLTPRQLPRVLDMEASRYVTLRFLLQTSRLRFISVWNPSFLSLLMQALPAYADRLIAGIARGTLNLPPEIEALPAALHAALARQLKPRPRRAAFLRRVLREHGSLTPNAVWPHLTIISCWTSAGAARFVPELRAIFPGIEIQPKGLLATEGVVSIPLLGLPGAAPALSSHFLEFIDEASPLSRPRLVDELVDELEAGRTYSVLLSTGGGLYRYALGDRVRVVGQVRAAPLIEFIGKADHVCDLCGEKLHENRVAAVLEAALHELNISANFAMLAPQWDVPPLYVLFVQAPDVPVTQLSRLLHRVEAGLREGHHYAYCRRLGQLGPLQGFEVCGDAGRAYLERCAALGQRRGDVKPVALHREPDWSQWFEGGPFLSSP